MADDAADNIKAAQKKQKRDYDCRHMSKTEIEVDGIVVLCYWKTTNDLIESAGSFHKNGSVPTLLWIFLTKELRL